MVRQPVWKMENWIQTSFTSLKIDLASFTAHSKRFGLIYTLFLPLLHTNPFTNLQFLTINSQQRHNVIFYEIYIINMNFFFIYNRLDNILIDWSEQNVNPLTDYFMPTGLRNCSHCKLINIFCAISCGFFFYSVL